MPQNEIEQAHLVGCSKCKLYSNELIINNALFSLNTYSLIKAISNNMCKAMKGDHYESDNDCDFQKNIYSKAALSLLAALENKKYAVKLKGEIFYFDVNTSTIFMSVFNKKDNKPDGNSDLTGDGGQLVYKALAFKNKINCGSIFDIGAQDIDFVARFPQTVANRYIVDVNVLTPFLQDRELSVKYLIGDAKKVFNNQGLDFFHPFESTVFAMSNFLNVLPPVVGWETLESILGKMKERDTLAITNLRSKQFKEKLSQKVDGQYYKYQKGDHVNGLVHYKIFDRVAKDYQHYKTTIKTIKFINCFKVKFPDIELIFLNKESLILPIGDQNHTVKFVTLLFEHTGLTST